MTSIVAMQKIDAMPVEIAVEIAEEVAGVNALSMLFKLVKPLSFHAFEGGILAIITTV